MSLAYRVTVVSWTAEQRSERCCVHSSFCCTAVFPGYQNQARTVAYPNVSFHTGFGHHLVQCNKAMSRDWPNCACRTCLRDMNRCAIVYEVRTSGSTRACLLYTRGLWPSGSTAGTAVAVQSEGFRGHQMLLGDRSGMVCRRQQNLDQKQYQWQHFGLTASGVLIASIATIEALALNALRISRRVEP